MGFFDGIFGNSDKEKKPEGRDIHGNPLDTDIYGHTKRDIFGNVDKDAWGNPKKDMWGNDLTK